MAASAPSLFLADRMALANNLPLAYDRIASRLAAPLSRVVGSPAVSLSDAATQFSPASLERADADAAHQPLLPPAAAASRFVSMERELDLDEDLYDLIAADLVACRL